jgi:hypothetical protein
MKISALVRTCGAVSVALIVVAVLLIVVPGCSGKTGSVDTPVQVPADDRGETNGADQAEPEDSSHVQPAPGGDSPGAPIESQSGGATATVDEPAVGDASATPVPARVDLVYFRTADACGCLAEIEDVIKAALQDRFPEELEDKSLRFHTVISDDPANAYYVRMYNSQLFDLFLVTYQGDKANATRVHEIWPLMNDYEALGRCVEALVERSLT